MYTLIFGYYKVVQEQKCTIWINAMWAFVYFVCVIQITATELEICFVGQTSFFLVTIFLTTNRLKERYIQNQMILFQSGTDILFLKKNKKTTPQ